MSANNPAASARASLGVSQRQLCRWLGIHRNTWHLWETGRRPIPGPALAWLHALTHYPAAARTLLDAVQRDHSHASNPDAY